MSWNSHRPTSPCQGDPEEDVNAHQDGVDCGQGHTKSQAKGHLPTAPVQKGERIRWHADQWTMHWHRVKEKSFRWARVCPSDTVTLLSWFWRSLQDYYEPMDPGTQLATQDTQEWSYRPLQDDQHQPIHFHTEMRSNEQFSYKNWRSKCDLSCPIHPPTVQEYVYWSMTRAAVTLGSAGPAPLPASMGGPPTSFDSAWVSTLDLWNPTPVECPLSRF